MTSVLVIGASGLLGQHLLAEAERRGFSAVGTAHAVPAAGLIPLDVSDAEAIRRVIRDAAPDLVLMAAAMTSVDGCERNPDLARAINAEAPRIVARECADRGIRLAHFSTDYVFDGSGAAATEDTPPKPINVYGRTKAEGEGHVRKEDPSSLVLRTSANFGWDRRPARTNSVTWILSKLRKGEPVPLFTDQSVSPSYVPDVARVAFDLWGNGESGVFHVACPDCLTRVDMGRAICEVFRLPSDLVRPAKLEDASLPASRPRRSCLAVAKVERTLNIRMRGFRDGLVDMRERE